MKIIKKLLLLRLYIEYNIVLDIYYNCVCIYGIINFFLLKKIYIKIIRRKIVIIIKSLCGAIL